MKDFLTAAIVTFAVAIVAAELIAIPAILGERINETRDALTAELYTVETFQMALEAGTGGPCGDGTIGHGISFGPREARQDAVVWQCYDRVLLETTQYGPPSSDLDSRGFIESRVILDLAGRTAGSPWDHLVNLLTADP